MDVISLGFLLIMILAGGLVALMADKLGRTLGKKRLTLFGLRPRHTATMITVLAGMLIPFITVLFVALVSKDVRDWIVEGRQAIGKAKAAQAQVDQLTVQKQDLATVTVGLKKQNEQELRKQREIEQRLAMEQAKLAIENQRVAALQGKLTALQSQQTKLTGSLQRVNLALSVATKDTKAAVLQREKAQAELAKAQDMLGRVKLSYTELKKQWNELNDKAMSLTADNDKLTSQNSSLATQNAKAATDLEMSKRNLEASQEQLDEVNTNLARANAEAANFAGFLSNDYTVSRMKPPIFSVGDELARVSIPSGCSAEEAKGLFANLMQEAVRQATVHGAGPFSNLIPERAALYPLKDPKGQTVTPEDQEQAIVKAITASKEDQVLVALCKYNTFLGEGVPLDIRKKSNPLVYRRDDQVAEVRINGGLPEADIRQQLVDFLTTTVKPKAIKDNMLPVSGQEEQFGEVPINDIVDLARSIHATDRRVKVDALASFDTHASDRLQLHFRVR